MKRILEVCADSLGSVRNAVEGGAGRIELCSALSLDGLTPSAGLLQTVRQLYPELTIHVLIRPRQGNFVYDRQELMVMERDIRAAQPFADGFVIGVLTPDGDIDMVAMQCLMAACGDKPVTFHRAFDVCREPFVALEQIVALGCRRLLSSGQQRTAEQGMLLLRQLHDLADGRLIIMPGGGVSLENARQIMEQVGTSEIHGSCSGGSGMTDADCVGQIIASIQP